MVDLKSDWNCFCVSSVGGGGVLFVNLDGRPLSVFGFRIFLRCEGCV